MIAQQIKGIAFGLSFAVPIIVLDQLSKWAVVYPLDLERQGTIAILPFLNFTFARNTGTAMSLVTVNSNQGRWIMVALTAVISCAILSWLGRAAAAHRITLAAILGGAIGNIIDRVQLGYVIDFIHLHLASHNFYIFNVADSAITLGVAGLLLFSKTTDIAK